MAVREMGEGSAGRRGVFRQLSVRVPCCYDGVAYDII